MILTRTQFYDDWLLFTQDKTVVECEFFELKENLVPDLLGDFSKDRLIAFGEHASGSLLSFYSAESEQPIEQTPVAWLDSEGAPCIVITNSLIEFLAILPYGMGFIYSVASLIENNLGDKTLLSKAREKFSKNANDLLDESRERFQGIDDLLNWMSSKNIPLSNDPAKIIVEAYEKNSELTQWIADNLT